MRKAIAAFVAVLILSAPLAARAQIVDQQRERPAPSYAEPANGGEAQIHGRILAFDGAYNVQVRDEKGYVDQVQLHQGTIINPTGLTLAPGMVVSIMGYNAGSFFAANEVDTPYTFSYGSPYYGGHPWNYYGPTVSLGFFFGNTSWWHGAYFGTPSHWNGGVRYYNNVQVNSFYRGGAYVGHNYVAPRNFGGYYPANERRYPAQNNAGYDRRSGDGNASGYERHDNGNGGQRHDENRGGGGGNRDGGRQR